MTKGGNLVIFQSEGLSGGSQSADILDLNTNGKETNASWLGPVGAFGSKVTSILQVEFIRRFESFGKILSSFGNSLNFLGS